MGVVWLKSLLVLHISPENKWFQTLSQGLAGLVAMFVSLLLLVQFYLFTLLKLVAWLLPIAGLALMLNILWRNERWKYYRGIILPRFVPHSGGSRHLSYGLLAIAYWFLVWWLLWHEVIWLGLWQYLSGEMLLRAVSAFKAPPGYYEVGSGEWLGSDAGSGPVESEPKG